MDLRKSWNQNTHAKSQYFRFFTIHEEESNKLPNIFKEKERLPENFVTSARRFDIVGYNLVKNFAVKRLKCKRRQ